VLISVKKFLVPLVKLHIITIGGITMNYEDKNYNGNHNNNDNKNLIQLCRSCHKRLHYIYKRLQKLGIIFPTV
jgi:hypothetical protein